MPELRSISVSGFKSIAKIERLKLRPINVLIGPNGSGKSNFIETFAVAHAIEEGRLHDYVARAAGADRLLHFSSRTTREITLHFDFADGMRTYRLLATESDELRPSMTYPALPDDAELVGTARAHLKRWRVYHFHDTSAESPMKKTRALDDNRVLRSDGANLAPFLNLLKEKYPPSYDLIRRTVQLAAPFFDDFQLAPRALAPDTIRLEWRHKHSDMYFDASSLSDGTLRFIALATLLLQPEDLRPSVILVDEPELGLHPAAITLFASLVKQVSQTTQVILSTQSSLLVDHFEPEDVLVADRVNGGTTLTRLSSEKLAGWLEDYSLGQLWEKGELGGRPAPE